MTPGSIRYSLYHKEKGIFLGIVNNEITWSAYFREPLWRIPAWESLQELFEAFTYYCGKREWVECTHFYTRGYSDWGLTIPEVALVFRNIPTLKKAHLPKIMQVIN